MDFTVTVPKGWAAQDGQCCKKNVGAPDELHFPFVPDTFYADACDGSQGERMAVGSSADDLAEALLKLRARRRATRSIPLWGYPAKRSTSPSRRGSI